MALVNIVLFAALLAIGAAEPVNFSACDESNDDMCIVNEVRINSCRKGNVCVLKQGSNATMAFDFTPYFSGSNLKTMVWWTSATAKLEFPGFGSDNACDYTSCPIMAGTQNINYKLQVGKKLPTGSYNINWMLRNPDNESEMCCAIMKIKITKGKK